MTLEDGDEQYEVESILARRGKGNRAQYLVKWVGYDHYESTWEKASNLVGAPEAIAAYEAQCLADNDFDDSLRLLTMVISPSSLPKTGSVRSGSIGLRL